MSHPWDILVGVAAVLGAVTAIFKFLHLGELLKGTRTFLLDWNGLPERPGADKIPSMPERINLLERRSESLNHNLAVELNNRVTLVAEGVDRIETAAGENSAALTRLDFRVNGIEQRITDHRRRNEEQVEALRVEVDRRLSSISGDLLRAETMRSIIAELGFDLDMPSRQADPGTPGPSDEQ